MLGRTLKPWPAVTSRAPLLMRSKSRMKEMPEKQLRDKDAKAAEGEGLPAHDHTVTIGETYKADAERRMMKAVKNVQNEFNKMHEHTSAQDENGDLLATLRRAGEDGIVDVWNTRRKLMQQIGRSAKKDKDISEDEQEIIADGVQQVTDKMVKRIDNIIKGKYEDLSKP